MRVAALLGSSYMSAAEVPDPADSGSCRKLRQVLYAVKYLVAPPLRAGTLVDHCAARRAGRRARTCFSLSLQHEVQRQRGRLRLRTRSPGPRFESATRCF